MTTKKAVVLLSGGLDSTTTLALAKTEGFDVYALTFDYGQRHSREIECARKVAERFDAEEHRIVKIDLRNLVESALTGASEVPKGRETIGSDIPPTYVPGRNLVFLSIAAAWAESIDSSDIFIGVSSVDYSGYPDCRPEFIESFQETVNCATKAGSEGRKIRVRAPFLNETKADVVKKGLEMGIDYGLTHSCYDPSAGGSPCGECGSCILRRRAFEEAGLRDPALG